MLRAPPVYNHTSRLGIYPAKKASFKYWSSFSSLLFGRTFSHGVGLQTNLHRIFLDQTTRVLYLYSTQLHRISALHLFLAFTMAVLKPLIVMGMTPQYSHVRPMRTLAKALILRGYSITVVTSSGYGPLFTSIGASVVPLIGYGNWVPESEETPLSSDERGRLEGMEEMNYTCKAFFVKPIPAQHEALQRAFKKLTVEHPGRKIVMLGEALFKGQDPILSGAPGIKPHASIMIGPMPICLLSVDVPPWVVGENGLPDSSPEGRQRNKALNQQEADLQNGPWAGAAQYYKKTMEDLGASPKHFWLDSQYLLPDRFLQMCPPSVEFKRSDAPSSIIFAGRHVPSDMVEPSSSGLPSWWKEDILHNPYGRKIVFVSQGTVAMVYTDLIIPAIKAFAESTDILLVVALGKKGARLPDNIDIPRNARVCDFIPFDDILQHADAYLTNGGYGGFLHSLSHGCPMVIGGATEDKPCVSLPPS